VTAFAIIDGELHAEGVPLSAIAERYGTPCYVYSRAALESRFRAFDGAFAARRISSATRSRRTRISLY
jgi:diaminopimelate decarboxylase